MAAKKTKVSKKMYQDAKAYYTHGGAAYDIEPMEISQKLCMMESYH